MLMSFVGSLGKLMEGLGLENTLGTIYGPNTIKQIKQEKEISRGVRAHILTEAALVFQLQRILLDKYQVNMADASEASIKSDIDDLFYNLSQDVFSKKRQITCRVLFYQRCNPLALINRYFHIFKKSILYETVGDIYWKMATLSYNKPVKFSKSRSAGNVYHIFLC